MRKKIVLIILIVIILLIPLVSPANAENSWYKCTVTAAGAAGASGVNIRLSDSKGAFTDVWFRCNAEQQNRMLATALTALSNDKIVRVYIDPSAPSIAERQIYSMYILP